MSAGEHRPPYVWRVADDEAAAAELGRLVVAAEVAAGTLAEAVGLLRAAGWTWQQVADASHAATPGSYGATKQAAAARWAAAYAAAVRVMLDADEPGADGAEVFGWLRRFGRRLTVRPYLWRPE